jgi:hypothetical protein
VIRIIFTVQVIHCEFSYKLYGDPLWVSPAYLLRTHNMHPTLAGTGVCVSPFLPARYTPHTHGVSYRKGPCTVCSFTVCLCGYFCSDLHTAYARRILQEGGLSNASYTNVQYRHTNTVYVLYIWRVNKRHMDTNVQYRHTNTVYVLYICVWISA